MRRIPWLVRIAMVILAVLFVVAIVGNVFTPYTSTQQNLLARLKPPFFLSGSDPRYLLGTDRLGRDMIARLIAGLRMSLSIALIGSSVSAMIGISIGFTAAHFRGLTEQALMTLVDMQGSMPFILIALTLLAFFGNSLVLFLLLMGLFGWEVYARITRGVVLAATSQPYAQAVRALGATSMRLYRRHILPNVASALIVQYTLNFPQLILLETSLSFLGLGIQPPQTSLGQILGDGRDSLVSAWWISVFPGITIFVTTLCISMVGDWLRDRLDPMLRGRTN